MSFQPVAPFSGNAGWLFLKRTRDAQLAAFAASGQVQANAERMRSAGAAPMSVESLLDDRRLLETALGAYGLEGDIGNRHFIRRILADGTDGATDLANRMADRRYRSFARDFAFAAGDTPAAPGTGFAGRVADRYVERAFEAGIGTTRPELRLALNTARELPAIAAGAVTDLAGWYEILGNPPLRQVFETAFGLPSAFSGLDLERQIDTLREKSRTVFGQSDIAAFSDPDRVEALLRRFLARSDAQAAQTAPGSVALALLSASG